jgi:2-polyprenyl-3-methyl-5-hydroxy-6-metoxy-1,4-benzoquinol methylase
MDRSERFWDRQSSNFDEQVMREKETFIRTISKTKEHLETTDTVLDFGCGTGTYTNEFADDVKAIHAIDISSKMIEVARRNAQERKIENVEYERSTLFDENLRKGTFDVVLGFNILHLLEGTQDFVKRINELLESEGLFISTTACLGERRRFLGSFLKFLSRIRVVPYLRVFKLSELEDEIVSGGFQIIETDTISTTSANHFIVAKKI